MKFDYIEIGTSDFETMCQEHPDKIGLSIEPLTFYCESLPPNDKLIRLNCAISNYKGIGEIFYVDPEDIDKFDLPQWLKGCNSFNCYHPSIKLELSKRKLDFLVKIQLVEVLNWIYLVKRYDINKVTHLKIDTEGHDLIIINDIIDSHEKYSTPLPDEIFFETNVLIDKNELNILLNRLESFNYEVVLTNFENTLVRRKC